MISTRMILLTLFLAAGTVSSINAQVRPTPTPTPAPARPTATPMPTPARAATPQTQTPAADAQVPQSRIALIDTSVFADEKKGIFRFIDAVKAAQAPYDPQNRELLNLQNRINAIIEDIRKLRATPQPDQRAIQTKQEEGSRLQQDWNTKKQRFDEDFGKRYQEVTAPISEQIGKAMDQYARERGITMTLDFSKLLPALLTALPAVDVTDAFIADFNRKNPRTGTPPRP
jgi:Skp family chaperone for outer membrane proteins